MFYVKLEERQENTTGTPNKIKEKLALPPMNYHSFSICLNELPRLPKTPHELLPTTPYR
jgi:hypothetical protein